MTSAMKKYQEGDEQDKLDLLVDAIKRACIVGGCACIKDMPGDNYTCTAHQFLWEVARDE